MVTGNASTGGKAGPWKAVEGHGQAGALRPDCLAAHAPLHTS